MRLFSVLTALVVLLVVAVVPASAHYPYYGVQAVGVTTYAQPAAFLLPFGYVGGVAYGSPVGAISAFTAAEFSPYYGVQAVGTPPVVRREVIRERFVAPPVIRRDVIQREVIRERVIIRRR